MLAAQDTIEIREGLAISGVVRGGRLPIANDPIQAALVDGTFRWPKAGDAIGERKWADAKAGADGAFPGNLFGGGFLAVTVTLPAARTMLLEASGHGMAYVNGEPRQGDVYGYGYVRLPVRLQAGANRFLFSSGRGNFRARLLSPKADVTIDLGDPTLPDPAPGDDALAGIVLRNATDGFVRGLRMEAAAPGLRKTTELRTLAPLTVRKVAVALPVPEPDKPGEYTVQLRLLRGGQLLDTAELKITKTTREATRRRTFFSAIDGSLQYYAVVPPKKPGPGNGFVLTVHGASVEAISQARAYRAKEDFTIVAPTNRRPFGFNWEDWGRKDGMEVLELALARYPHAKDRVYLTGHSMGGHGTWHLGTLYPDRFAAIAPAAGWVSYWTYGGGYQTPENPSPMERLLRRTLNVSDTLARGSNTQTQGVYVLHGAADDNVPVQQARIMRDALAPTHPDYTHFELEGAGHWWGDDSVDWPGIFEMFARRRLAQNPDQIDFVTPNPRASATMHWVKVVQQDRPLEMSRVTAHRLADSTRIDTENVRTLEIARSGLRSNRVSIDGKTLVVPATGPVTLRKGPGGWKVGKAVGAGEKNPDRSGPFKEGFNRQMVFVFGTQGTPEENAWAYAKARYDAEQWYYIGNGAVDLVADRDLDLKATKDRNLIVYGHAGMVRGWSALLGGAPVGVTRDGVRVGDRRVSGDDLAMLFVVPRPGSDKATVTVVGATGPKGMRLTYRLPYFSGGVAYPDWLILRSSALRLGVSAFVGGGYFTPDWKVDPSDSVWQN